MTTFLTYNISNLYIQDSTMTICITNLAEQYMPDLTEESKQDLENQLSILEGQYRDFDQNGLLIQKQVAWQKIKKIKTILGQPYS